MTPSTETSGVTEPGAVKKFERGTFRSRSIEIGPYESNNGKITAPAVLGLAMVDIPAVEGLFQRQDSKEIQVNFTQEELDWAVASAYAQANEDAAAHVQSDLDWAMACAYAEGDIAGRAEMADKDRAPFMFQLGDNDASNDFASVQRRLDALNQFVDEVTEKSRVDFIDSLVTDSKIGAPNTTPSSSSPRDSPPSSLQVSVRLTTTRRSSAFSEARLMTVVRVPTPSLPSQSSMQPHKKPLHTTTAQA